MKWFCRHWYEVGLFPAGIALVFLLIMWGDMQILQRISVINFIGIMLHQFEEYGFPGGAPTFGNKYIGSLSSEPVFRNAGERGHCLYLLFAAYNISRGHLAGAGTICTNLIKKCIQIPSNMLI